MKKEFSLEDEWLAYQLRPETPEEGILLTTLFPGADLTQRYESLNRAGEPYGIHFAHLERVRNSQSALEAAEYAKDVGKFHEFHERVFHAYFTELQDIGNVELLAAWAQEIGMDAGPLLDALKTGMYKERLEEAHRSAAANTITAVPTFIIEDSIKLVGAQPINVFKQKLLSLEK